MVIPVSRSRSLENRSSVSRLRGCHTSHTASSSRPMSRTISMPYAVCPGATSPPPPKHPQSMLRPRAAAEVTAAMKTSERDTALADRYERVAIAGEQQHSERDLSKRKTPSDDGRQ